MVEAREIIKFADEIARRFKPLKIILFGSYASGEPTEDSDVDLAVVKSYRGPSYREAARLCDGIVRSFPLDLIMYSPGELRRLMASRDYLALEIVQTGISLYDAKDQSVGREGRRRLQRRLGSTTLAQTRAV